ncbi:hypothetical protein LWI29_005880 [Acer saccharum]|uniref:BED-type domain-containing protein n=1 Tax=Acer saccharum TaxID=4024 RepID=A0AA39W4S7_ACESA|nr:hypothetical protein LWI29_005880 [Acer saccharum]
MTSNVWQVFDLHESEDNNGNKIQSAICKLCNTSLVAGARNGINHLKRHMDECLAKHGPQDPKQQQLARPSGYGGKVCTFTYSQSKMRIGLAVYIASAELPFSLRS